MDLLKQSKYHHYSQKKTVSQNDRVVYWTLIHILFMLTNVSILSFVGIVFYSSSTVLSFLKWFSSLQFLLTLFTSYGKVISASSSDTSIGSKRGSSSDGQAKRFVKICSVTLVGAVLYHIVTVLFGAPFMSLVEQTFLFAVQMSVLSILPLYLAYNCDLTKLRDGVFCQSLEKDLPICKLAKISSYCCMAGAWGAAALLPLDWDRDWQTWPIPCSVGGFFGNVIGLILGITHISMAGNRLKLP